MKGFRGARHEGAKPWGSDDFALLLRLCQGRLSDAQIAEKMGRLPGSVRKHRQRLGIPGVRERPKCKRPWWGDSE